MREKILIFSDTHLTHLPDKRKLNFLLSIIDSADTVIVNGDFWEKNLTSAEKFATAPSWQPLFQALKTKKAHYLYGNHDPAEACHGIEPTFSSSHGQRYEFTQAGQHFHVEHGNIITPDLDELRAFLPRPILGLATLADNALTRLGKERFLHHYKSWNEKMKRWQKEHMDTTTYLICGHSHYSEVSANPLFANSGVIRGGFGSYLTIEDGIVTMQQRHY
jgi:predicted phosphodiesterase